MKAKVAVVDDDPEMLQLLSMLLIKEGYDVKTFPSPGKFLDSLEKSKPDLCVLDMHMPGIHGREVIRILRQNEATKRLPIVAMSAVARSTPEVILGLDLGADEYMPKPLDLELLVVRIDGLLKRAGGNSAASSPAPSEKLRYGDVIVFLEEHRVTVDDLDVALTNLEFKLLVFLLRHPNRVATRGMLLEKVWGSNPDVSTRTVDKHFESLRKKIPIVGARVETVIRVGYLFRP